MARATERGPEGHVGEPVPDHGVALEDQAHPSEGEAHSDTRSPPEKRPHKEGVEDSISVMMFMHTHPPLLFVEENGPPPGFRI